MSDDSESYLYQLEQVELALSKDPENEEFKKLQQDLKELIALTQQLEQQQKKSTTQSPKTPISPQSSSQQGLEKKQGGKSTVTVSPTPVLKTHQFSVGQDVMARWSGDGQFYRATITAIGGADQVFSVSFRGYAETEMVKAEDVKALDSKKRQGIFEGVGSSSTAAAAAAAAAEEELQEQQQQEQQEQPPAKRGRKDKSQQKKKVSEVEVKKNAWLNFASGADGKKKKKRMAATPINKKSIFKTPDNPEGKVGVVGSGRGMTSFQQRGKHLYSENKHDEED
ncbi:hypothetical protein BDB00DRAFT_928643 [Zychaea mexicana]|uniref:uncharacterized protein n=1 Tax=Zychaea mexicana TaxID=64656 RepID=UPI0022FE68DF|nr:uncharacterized protein BDB00DRAFT_928643 [Zychaea mexicana]KAI9493923.1 hypothetical protein BDB00DRAFT_928643 [Zychaea mexicana]